MRKALHKLTADNFHVPGACNDCGFGGSLVTPCSSSFLKVAFDTFGKCRMNHLPDIGLINSHSKGRSCHHNGFPSSLPVLDKLCFVGTPSVKIPCMDSFLSKLFHKGFAALASTEIQDSVPRTVFEHRPYGSEFVFGMNDLIRQI